MAFSHPPTCLNCNNSFENQHLPEPFDILPRLRSGVCPTVTEENQTRGFLEDVEKEQARLEAEISRLQDVIKSLQVRSEALLSQGEKCKSLLAPIRRLPLEVLAQIFALCGPNHIRLYEAHVIPALRLGRVCYYWNRGVISTRQIWSHIVLEDDSTERASTCLQKVLKLGGNVPLNFSSNHLIDTDSPYRSTLYHLVQHCRRWQSMKIDLIFPDSPETRSALEAITGNIPVLEYLDISAFRLSQSIHSFEICPRLREVRLHSMDCEKIRLPWQQLTSFKASDVSARDVCLVVQQAIALEQLEVIKVSKAKTEAPAPMVMGSALKCLSISLEDNDHYVRSGVAILFKTLTLPSLAVLSLQNCMPDSDIFNKFILRSSCPLESLTVTHLRHDSGDLVQFLEPLHHLQSLAIKEPSQSSQQSCSNPPVNRAANKLLTRMTFDPKSPSKLILPHLRHFELETSSNGRFCGVSEQILVKWIKSQVKRLEASPSTLLRVDLKLYDRILAEKNVTMFSKVASLPGVEFSFASRIQ